MKRIKLTQGKFALVDDADFEWLMQWKWWLIGPKQYRYAKRAVQIEGKRLDLLMHRVITRAPQNLEVDHINHNGLDNRRKNLRLCTRQENRQNAKIFAHSSRYKGVCWHKQAQKWLACITHNYKQISLGMFNNEEDAAVAYNNKAKDLFGKFAHLNPV